MKKTPRPYQLVARNKTVEALKASARALIVMATGLGKTLTAALASHLFGKSPLLFLAHNNDLLERAMKTFREVWGGELRYGLYNGHSKDVEGYHLVFAMFQTMTNNLEAFKRDKFGIMIVDEAHHGHARTFKRTINHFTCPRIALTATPKRMDKKDIRELFGLPVVKIELEEAIAQAYLPPIEYHIITEDGLDEDRMSQLFREVLEEGKRISLREINRRIFIKARDEKIASIITSYNLPTVIFCRNTTHADNMHAVVKDSAIYHSKNSSGENTKALTGFETGRIRYLIAVNAFNEGLHLQGVGLVVFLRETASETIFRQQLGRGLETGGNKLIVLDFVANIERIRQIKRLAERVAEYHERITSSEGRERENYVHDKFHISGKGFNFTFTQKIVDILRIVEQAEVELYSTWQEAGHASVKVGVTSSKNYYKLYHKDPLLPSNPSVFYADWPGWGPYLGTKRVRGCNFYSTAEAAKEAIRNLRIKNTAEYKKKRKKDPRLPADHGRHTGTSEMATHRFFRSERGCLLHIQHGNLRRKQLES